MKHIWRFMRNLSVTSNTKRKGHCLIILSFLIGTPLLTNAQDNYTDYRDGSNHESKQSYMTDVIAIDVDGSNDMEFITNSYRVTGSDYGLSLFTKGYESLRIWSGSNSDKETYMRLAPSSWTYGAGSGFVPIYSKANFYLGGGGDYIGATYNAGLSYYSPDYHLFTGGKVGIGEDAAEPEAHLHVNSDGGYTDIMIGDTEHSTNDALRLLGDYSGGGIIQVGSSNDSNNGDLTFSTLYNRNGNMNSFTVRADDATFTGDLGAVNGTFTGNISGVAITSSHEINVGKGIILANQEGDFFGTWDGTQYTTEPTVGTLMFDYNWANDEYNWENYFVEGSNDDVNVGGLALYSPNLGFYEQSGWEMMLSTHNMYLLKAKFHSVATTDVIVRPDGNFPDYVFDKDYKLMPLEEVESYVKENHHLPNVISAKEAEEKGVSVSKMQETLLEKVEELTLYMIQLKKENESLKQRVKQLEADK